MEVAVDIIIACMQIVICMNAHSISNLTTNWWNLRKPYMCVAENKGVQGQGSTLIWWKTSPLLTSQPYEHWVSIALPMSPHSRSQDGICFYSQWTFEQQISLIRSSRFHWFSQVTVKWTQKHITFLSLQQLDTHPFIEQSLKKQERYAVFSGLCYK